MMPGWLSLCQTKTDMPLKYEPLEMFLRATPSGVKQLTLRLSELADIIGASLPDSAFTHRPWWANQKNSKTRPQSHAWMAAGFVVEEVNQSRKNGWVRFKRQ